ncbi:MAG: hypothetical protein KKI18_02275 [Planctomycetes bacterium]|nr:hypothetical protein [Planctomycetota bacterium]MBU1517729.1 hypothetical protein [Planctomycetota bacterium]
MKKYLFPALAVLIAACTCSGVTSKIIRHKTFDDFSKGKTENTVISSRGTISLAAQTQTLADDFNDVWTINSIACKSDGSVYIGTSPNGKIFKYKDGKTVCIYPARQEQKKNGPARTHLTNEHVFKLALDSKDNLIAGISGDKCCLVRYDGKKFETVFEPEPNQASYIFAITLDKAGNIFLGTGPKGQIWQLDNNCRNPQLIYTCQDKNVLCLAFANPDAPMRRDLRLAPTSGLCAGTDTRGLVYKIDPKKKTASILYDSDENEITDLLFDDSGNLYAAATSYKSIKAQLKGGPELKKPFSLGKPENQEESEESSDSAENKGASLEIANTPQDGKPADIQIPPEIERNQSADSASHIYKIDTDGFITDIFSETAAFFAIHLQNDHILLGTGNKAQLFSINPKTEIESMIYEDKKASQITDIKKFGNDVIFSTANPPRLIALKSTFAQTGYYESDLIDAGQPAQWGKLQIEADVPDDTKIMLSARSGNVDDINDPTFSAWTEPVKITQPVNLTVPLGRFCQYKLILGGTNAAAPEIRQVAAAYVIPNLAPKVTDVSIGKADKDTGSSLRKIDFKAEDENSDQLLYQIDFRKKGRTGWIKLIDELDKPAFDWDSKTVEDGVYEIRVTASDELNNNQSTKLTGSRISEPAVIDNTAPAIESHQLQANGNSATLTLKAVDQFSAIDSLSYTIDSNEKWISVLPDDNVFDTKAENFTIKAKKMELGQHVLAVRISDAEGNTMYKTFDVDIKK